MIYVSMKYHILYFSLTTSGIGFQMLFEKQAATHIFHGRMCDFCILLMPVKSSTLKPMTYNHSYLVWRFPEDVFV